MYSGLNKCLLLLTAGIFITLSNTQAQETDPLTITEGYVEKKLGTKVEKVVIQDGTGVQEVTISVPKQRVDGEIEEVVVTAEAPGKSSAQTRIPQVKPYEFIKDYDHDHYGLVIYLGKDLKVPLRLYFSTGPDID